MENRKSASCWDAVKRHKWLSAAGLLAVAAVALAMAAKASGGKGMQKGAALPGGMGGGQMNNVSTVHAEKPQPGTIERTASLSGTVEPSDVVYVYAKAGGDVTSVLVKAGDTVEAGQLLCTIDTDQVESAKNSMDSAAVSLSEAQSTLSRMQLLYQGGDISDQEWEQYQNKVKTAKLQYDSAKLNYERQVEYSSVTAPIGGRIETCDIETFDRVSQNAQLCVISGEGEKRVSFYVTERVVAKLKQGDAITIRKNGEEYQGSISDVSTMVDETNGLFKVKAELPEAGSIATGSTVKVTVVSDRAENVMTVPVDAVYYNNSVGSVYLYEDGTVHKQQVEVGLYDSERAQILSGLTGEEMVISTWSSQLYEGSTVKLKGEAESAAASGGAPGEKEKGMAPEAGREAGADRPDGERGSENRQDNGGQRGAPGQNQ